ncbi:hypothetical protein AAG906_015957 [Vitis piasezkii]
MELAKLFLSYLPIHHSRYSAVLSLSQGINMSTQVSACSLAQIPKPKIVPVTNFHPNIWVTRACKVEQIEDLKREVKRKLTAATANHSLLLNFIDAVQRLGVAYHFEQEIEEALQHIYNSFHDLNDIDGDLYNVALGFRLLRQQGYNISCGRFKEVLMTNVQGMLGLYEAAHLRAMVESLGYPLAEQVVHALNRPIRKGLERIEARWYISVYQDEAFHDKTLLELAKLDFNLVQSLHRKITFARDRLVEGYFWILGVYFEPQYLRARRILTKVIAMTSILDDIYDAYGNPEELKLFTEAIERWDINSIDQLPEYMKLCYAALLDVYKEIEEEMEKEGHQYRVHYAKEVMKNQVRAYFAEAKWLHEEHVPTIEEYLRVALVSSGYCMLATTSLVGMGEIATKEAFDWVTSDPKIMSSSNFIARLMDDISSHKHVASAIECYMKQYGVSEEQAYSEFRKQIENEWMDINQECLKPTALPMPLLARVLNLTRAADVIYKEQDSYTHVGKVMKNNIAAFFINPII